MSTPPWPAADDDRRTLAPGDHPVDPRALVIGRLPFDGHRELVRVAAASRRSPTGGTARSREPGPDSTRPPDRAAAGPEHWRAELPTDDERRVALEHAIATATVGPPHALSRALCDDGRGWCPSFAFTSRAEAFRALSDAEDSLAVHRFVADHVWWFEPVAVAEWTLTASIDVPLLVDDDVLVEADRRPVTLCGISIAELRDGRIVSIHTTFDDAALIEQVLLPHAGSASAPRVG